MPRFFAFVILAFVLMPFSPGAAAQSVKQPPATQSVKQPLFDLTDPVRIDAGKARFNARCAGYCHGIEGSGGRTQAFKGRSSFKAEEVFKVITEGSRSDDVMPSFVSMPVEARWELVAYIMCLSRQKPELSHRVEPPFDLTDPVRIDAGKARFNARCAGYCHGIEGSGGRTQAFKGRSSFKAEEVFKVITEGSRSDDVMPSFVSMPVEARWELVAYIMYLSRQKAELGHRPRD